jgi:hypothetical protein
VRSGRTKPTQSQSGLRQPSPAVTNQSCKHAMFCGVQRTAGSAGSRRHTQRRSGLPDSAIGLATEPGSTE